MKILVTGAHFTPAVATITELKKNPKVEVVYVGRKTTKEGDQAQSVESQMMPEIRVRFIPITTGRLQRDFTIYTIPSLLKIPTGFLQAFFILLSEKPNVVLSFGGYVAVPVVVMAWLFSIPIIIHEQTLMPGLANRISAIFADKIAVSFNNNAFKGEKVILTGNPIRQEVIKKSLGANSNPSPRWNREKRVLVIGGNQGSHIINIAIEKVLDQLLKIAKVIHQTGDSKYQDFERLSRIKNNNYKVFKFISQDWPEVLADADLVISRAGINSLTELAYSSKPTLLIPIPGKEQKTNAEYFSNLGLGQVLPQSELSAETLFKKIKLMLNNLSDLKEKARQAKKVVIEDAAKRLALETILLVKNPYSK